MKRTKKLSIAIVALALMYFFLCPMFSVKALFSGVLENSEVGIYVKDLSKEWDRAMKNSSIMNTIAYCTEEDLSKLRNNTGLQWTLRLLTGNHSVVGVVGDFVQNQRIDDNNYLVGVSYVGAKYRIMHILHAIKYVPGLGKLGVTEDGVRYLDFSKFKVGPNPYNPVLALDLEGGMLCVAFTTKPSNVKKVVERVREKKNPARVFGNEPWRVLKSGKIPTQHVIWAKEGQIVCGISSLDSNKSPFVRALVSPLLNKKIGVLCANAKPIAENDCDRIPIMKFPIDDALMLGLCDSNCISVFLEEFGGRVDTLPREDGLVAMCLMGAPYKMRLPMVDLPTLHMSFDDKSLMSLLIRKEANQSFVLSSLDGQKGYGFMPKKLEELQLPGYQKGMFYINPEDGRFNIGMDYSKYRACISDSNLGMKVGEFVDILKQDLVSSIFFAMVDTSKLNAELTSILSMDSLLKLFMGKHDYNKNVLPYKRIVSRVNIGLDNFSDYGLLVLNVQKEKNGDKNQFGALPESFLSVSLSFLKD